KISIRLSPDTGSRGYPVLVGKDLLPTVTRWIREQGVRNAFVVGDRRLGKLVRETERSLRKQGCAVESVTLAASEKAKDYRKIFPVYARMIESGLDRKGLVIAIGGGVIGDLTGF